jgi:hypothetical protein
MWGRETSRLRDCIKRTLENQTTIFNLAMSICGLLGGLGVAGSIYWESRYQAQPHDQFVIELGSLLAQSSKPSSEQLAQLVSRWQESLSKEHFGPEIIRDLSIALLVSVFVTVSIELYAGKRLRTQIAGEVLEAAEAAFEKFIPDVIYKEVADNVFRSNVFRRQWSVDMSVLNEHQYKEMYDKLRQHYGQHILSGISI